MGKKKHAAPPAPPGTPLPAPAPPIPLPAPMPSGGTPAPALWPGMVVHHLVDAHLAALRAMNVRQVRWTLYWSLWADGGQSQRDDIDAQIRRALDAGLELLVCVHSTPDSLLNVTPGDPTARGYAEWAARDTILPRFVDFLHAVALQYPGVAWQPWNEFASPAYTHLFCGPRGDFTPADAGARYALHLHDVAAAVALGDAGTRLVAAAPAAPGAGDYDAFVGMLGQSAHLSVDAFALHAYGPPSITHLVDDAIGYARACSTARLAMPYRPLWSTEFGISGAQLRDVWGTPRAQWDAKQTADWADSLAAAKLYVERAFGYCLDFDGDDGFSVLARDGALRGVGVWLRDAAAGITPGVIG